MSERTARSMYYIDGSAVRKMEAAPERRHEEKRRIVEKPQVREHKSYQLSDKAERALAFNLRYTVFVVSSVLIMVVACVLMLYMETRINAQQNNINNLETQLEAIQADNAAYKVSLDNMYTLDQVYDVAVNELGMVYAKKGQIVYYDSANEDYVKQYQDVPEAN